MKSQRIRIILLFLAALIGILAFYFNSKYKEEFSSIMTSNEKKILTNTTSTKKITTESGLQYRVLKNGEGTVSPGPSSVVTVHYIGKLTNGVEFDSSYMRNKPASFPVDGVIPGWTEALQLMRVGDKWELTIPPDLGYGSQGAGKIIPPDATLIFEVELLEIE